MIPPRARVVIVGGGVIGVSIAYHLTKLGVSDVLVLERKQLTSGSTWHAAGVIASGGTQNETNTWIARYSRDLYANLEAETGLSTGFNPCGYLQLATTDRRREAYRRETAFMQAYGIDKHEISAAECADLHPLMRTDDVMCGFWTPDEGRANPVDVTMSLAKGARTGGATLLEDVEVTGFRTANGAVTGVETTQGFVECETVVLAAGLWSRELASRAGVLAPLQACEHYYLLTEPIAGIERTQPLVEDTERYAYFREEGGGMLVGLFEPVAAPWALDGTPRDSAFAVLPPDWDRVGPFLETAFHRYPDLADAGIRTLFCGPESFTTDLSPMVGEAPELRNFFLACGMNSFGVLAGGAIGSILASWIVDGRPPVDVSHFAPDRMQPYESTRRYRAERSVDLLGALLNDASWPNYAPSSARGIRRSPIHDRLVERGAHFSITAGWEYPEFFAGPGSADAHVPWGFERGLGWDCAAAEHRALREAVGVIDLTSMSKFLVQGPDAMRVLNAICTADVDVPVGRIVYTPWCDERGLLITELTVTRLATDKYLVVCADLVHRRIPSWIERHTPEDAFITVTDMTSAFAILSVQGPRSRELLERVSPNDLSNSAFPYLSAQSIEVGYAPITALRVTYVGELGWELHIPTEYAASVYDLLHEAGGDLGLRDVGAYALDGCRVEKAYRDFGVDVDMEDTPYDVGLGFAVALDKPGGFVGRDALMAAKAAGTDRRLVSIRLLDSAFDLRGDEPLWLGDRLLGYNRAGAYGHSVGGAVGLAMLEGVADLTATQIGDMEVSVNVAGTRVAARMSVKPFFDPDRRRPQGEYV